MGQKPSGRRERVVFRMQQVLHDLRIVGHPLKCKLNGLSPRPLDRLRRPFRHLARMFVRQFLIGEVFLNNRKREAEPATGRPTQDPAAERVVEQ